MTFTTQTLGAFFKVLAITMLGLAFCANEATAQFTNFVGPVGINTTTPITDLDVRGQNIFLSDNPKEPFPDKFAAMGTAGGICTGWGFRTQTSGARYMTMFMRGATDASTVPTISFSDPFLEIRKDLGEGCGTTLARFNDGNIRFFEDFQFGSAELLVDGGSNTAELRNANFIPNSNNSWDLGFATNRWRGVYCTFVDAGSDSRLKNNIQNLSYGLNELMQLRPVIYNINDAPEKGRTIGLIAQEVQEVMSEVVSDPSKRGRTGENGEKIAGDPNGMLGLYYMEMIPVLIKGIQEQQAQIEELKARLDGTAPGTSQPSIDDKGLDLNGVQLYQNAPNPFNDVTRIEYQLPSDVKSAQVFVFDMQGKQVSRIEASPRAGRNKVEIRATSLEAGMYIYSLIVNGREMASKRMIISQ